MVFTMRPVGYGLLFICSQCILSAAGAHQHDKRSEPQHFENATKQKDRPIGAGAGRGRGSWRLGVTGSDG